MIRRAFIPVSLVLGFWIISEGRLHLNGPSQQLSVDHVSPLQSTPLPDPGESPPKKAESGLMVAPVPVEPFKYQRELATFQDLQGKVFLSSEEKEVRKALLSHILLIRALGDRLLVPAASASLVLEQELAVDLLLAALEEGDAESAREVLKTVVLDAQVEDPALSEEVRTQLAGAKAEVLYHWSALDPRAAIQIPDWLPGPVSQKIWANIERRQQANLAEGEAHF